MLIYFTLNTLWAYSDSQVFGPVTLYYPIFVVRCPTLETFPEHRDDKHYYRTPVGTSSVGLSSALRWCCNYYYCSTVLVAQKAGDQAS